MPRSFPSNIITPGKVVNAGGWTGVFENEAPLNLEIGVGGGEFILGLASRAPDENFVGIDIAGLFLRKAARKIERLGLPNVRFLVADAKVCLHDLFDPEGLHAVYINFPDPWPKRGHEKRRHFDDFFVSLLEDRLAPGGILHLATDVEAYADEAYDALSKSPYLRNAHARPWVNSRDWSGLETRYELKWRDQGKQLHYLAFSKSAPVDVDRYPRHHLRFEPLEAPGLELAHLASILRGRVETIGPYLFKTLATKAEDNSLRAKILLVEKEKGFADYFHAVFEPKGTSLQFNLANAADIVYTEDKRRVLTAYLERLAE